MKILISILSVCFVIITACIIYIMKSGVSMRAAPYIKPTVIADDFQILPEHLFLRLFPDLQSAHYVLWGVSVADPDVQRTLSGIQELYENQLHGKVTLLDAAHASAEEVKACPKPCWILFPPDQAHQLSPNSFVSEKIEPITADYISITWINFTNPEPVPEFCVEQKRLDLFCMKWVGLRDAQRRFKDEGLRYFFLRKYLDHDYFVFVRQANF